MKPDTLQHLIQLRDLSETTFTPLHAIALMVRRISQVVQSRWPELPVCDIRGPRIMTVKEEFEDLFIPPNHPQRQADRVRYISGDQLLRSHMTPLVGKAFGVLRTGGLEHAAFLLPGICYSRTLSAPERVAEPHKLDLWICRGRQVYQQSRSPLLDEVKSILQGIFQGKSWNYRVSKKVHPYTAEGLSVEVSLQSDHWIKILECGEASAKLLEKNGLNPRQYRVSAFGIGLERCVMAVKELHDIRLLRHHYPWIQEQMSDLLAYREHDRHPSVTTEQHIPTIPKVLLLELFEQMRWQQPSLFELIYKINSFQESDALRLNVEWHSPVQKVDSAETHEGVQYISNLADELWNGKWKA